MGEVKKLVENGRWVIPVEERPKDWRSILFEPDYPPAAEPAIADAAAEGPKPATCKPKQWTWHGWTGFKRAIERSAREGGWKGDTVEAALILVAGMWSREPEILAKRIPGKNTALFAQRCTDLELWKDGGLVELGDMEFAGDLDLWMRAGAIAGVWFMIRENGETLFKSVGA